MKSTTRLSWMVATSRQWTLYFGAIFLIGASVLAVSGSSALGQGKGGGGGGGGSTPPPNPAIAYVDGGIKVMNEDGTNQRLVVSGGSAHAPAWSPDNSELAYWGNHNYVRGIYRVRLDGTDRRLVTPFTSAYILWTYADWSPQPTLDGNHKIAYEDSFVPDGDIDIYVVNPDGTGKVQLTNTPDVWELYPVWLSDGRLAFDRWDIGHELVVCELGLVDGQIAIVSETVADATGDHSELGAAQTQATLAFNRVVGSNARVLLLDALGNMRLLTAGTTGDERRASFSPSDAKLSFWRGGRKGGIFTINADGTGERKISSKGYEPRWKR